MLDLMNLKKKLATRDFEADENEANVSERLRRSGGQTRSLLQLGKLLPGSCSQLCCNVARAITPHERANFLSCALCKLTYAHINTLRIRAPQRKRT